MDVRVVFIFAVVVLAPIFVTAQNQQSGAKSGQKTQEANPAVPISVNCNCTSQAADSKDKPQGWHKFVTWPEGIATWALIFTLGAIVWQAIETRRSVKTSLRPKLVIRGIAVSDEGENGWFVECQIANIGGSKARIAESNLTIKHLGITAHDRLPTFPPYEGSKNWLGKCKIAPAEHKRAKVALGFATSAFSLSFLRAARQEGANVNDTLHCSGFIQYRDAMRIQRRTAFCLHYNSVSENFDRIDQSKEPNYEYAD
jgi:hypothetical protein